MLQQEEKLLGLRCLQSRIRRCNDLEIAIQTIIYYKQHRIRQDRSLRFSANKRIFLHGVRVGGKPGQDEYQISLEVEGASKGTVRIQGTYTSDENRGLGFDVMLPKPLCIDPSVKITIMIQGQEGYANSSSISGAYSYKGVTLQFEDCCGDDSIEEIIIST